MGGLHFSGCKNFAGEAYKFQGVCCIATI
jgi:hypothetical protein